MRDGSAGLATPMLVRMLLPCLLAFGAACGDDPGNPDAGVERATIAAVPATANGDVDLLFVIDDSTSVLHWQTQLKLAFPSMLRTLDMPGGRPNLHIGVVSPDLGTLGALDTQPGPSIGSGAGSCAGNGRGGVLQTNNTTLVSGSFISDVANPDGTRTVNYTGTLEDAFSAIASLGSSGCGFEQPLEAMKRALNNNPANTGFFRASANLAVVMLMDEDDCSFAHATLVSGDTTLGPLQSFRCTQYGVTCDVGGTTPEAMNTLGDKSGCHASVSSDYVMPVAPYGLFLMGLKNDPRQVYLAAIAGPPTPFAVEARTPPGGGTAVSALAHSCEAMDTSGIVVADPGVRIDELARGLPRGSFTNICDFDFVPALTDAAREIRNMVGDPCLHRSIAHPADCTAVEIVDGRETELPSCATARHPCFDVVEDPAGCSAEQHLRLDVQRETPAPAGAVVELRCRT